VPNNSGCRVQSAGGRLTTAPLGMHKLDSFVKMRVRQGILVRSVSSEKSTGPSFAQPNVWMPSQPSAPRPRRKHTTAKFPLSRRACSCPNADLGSPKNGKANRYSYLILRLGCLREVHITSCFLSSYHSGALGQRPRDTSPCSSPAYPSRT